MPDTHDKDDRALRSRRRPHTLQELIECWPHLDESDRDYILRGVLGLVYGLLTAKEWREQRDESDLPTVTTYDWMRAKGAGLGRRSTL